MRVLVVGGGGREHALGWGLARSASVESVAFCPGNPGTARLGENWPSMEDSRLIERAETETIDLVVVGPEAPLASGLADALRAKGIAVFGPNRAAAELESSKHFAKEFMTAAGVPTAASVTIESADAIDDACATFSAPPVVKADGLAAGKGVVVPESMDDAKAAARDMLAGAHGEAGHRVVFEERLHGVEVSQLALVSGSDYALLETARDHKRLEEGDRGPNTGGMGAFSPSPDVDDAMRARIEAEVIRPTVDTLVARDLEFRGLLYVGLMLTPDGPKVLEYNVRFGDPETQPLVMRWKDDLGELFRAVATGELGPNRELDWDPRPTLCWVLATRGYPQAPEKGKVIRGPLFSERGAAVQVFHAGTTMNGDEVVTSGGRVFGVTAMADDLAKARQLVEKACAEVEFDGKFWRADIGG